jgi:hypothetical protein
MPKGSKGEKALSKRVSVLEREVGAMKATVPERPEDQVSRQAASSREGDVAQTLARLGGRSTSGAISDQDRGPVSSLGHGSHSQPMRRGRRK